MLSLIYFYWQNKASSLFGRVSESARNENRRKLTCRRIFYGELQRSNLSSHDEDSNFFIKWVLILWTIITFYNFSYWRLKWLKNNRLQGEENALLSYGGTMELEECSLSNFHFQHPNLHQFSTFKVLKKYKALLDPSYERGQNWNNLVLWWTGDSDHWNSGLKQNMRFSVVSY